MHQACEKTRVLPADVCIYISIPCMLRASDWPRETQSHRFGVSVIGIGFIDMVSCRALDLRVLP